MEEKNAPGSEPGVSDIQRDKKIIRTGLIGIGANILPAAIRPELWEDLPDEPTYGMNAFG